MYTKLYFIINRLKAFKDSARLYVSGNELNKIDPEYLKVLFPVPLTFCVELRFLKKLHGTLIYINKQLFSCIFCTELMEKGSFSRWKTTLEFPL